MLIAEFLILFGLPVLILYLIKHIPFLNTIGAVALCYFSGFVLAMLPIGYDKELSQTVASVLVAAAIPLILFGFDLRSVRSLAKSTIIAYGLVALSAIVIASSAAFIAAEAGLKNTAQLAGMTVGLYTGGTPNLIAIGSALLSPEDAPTVISAANTSDFLFGGVYFLLILTIMKPLYKRVLGERRYSTADSSEHSAQLKTAQNEYDYASIPRDRKSIIKLAGVILLAVVCLGVGAVLEILINGDLSGSLYIMITVSVLGIAFSFIRPIREVKGSYQIGQYLVLVFSLGLSMSIDISVLMRELLPTLAFFAAVQTATILLHFILCRIFRIDGGTALITSTAGIYGPPFIAPVAEAYGDRELIAPGVICGIIGLVIGNLLGITVGSLISIFV